MPLRRRLAVLASALVATVLAGALAASPAWACGGFFCFTQPVDQSAERILYLRHEGKVTAHIQISYQGDDDKFSWVLPLQKKPTLGIGSDSVFTVLEQWTSPQFQLQWQPNGNCYGGWGCFAEDAAGGPPQAGSGGGTKGVTVLAQENVGPYETVTIQGESGAELVQWLNDNGYQQPASTTSLIDLYAKQKYVFLALKLQKDKGTGDLAPMVVTVDETSPCLPLRLTQIAATPDMPIVAWVLGEHRAIPKNFLHVELNEATLDWLQPGANYKTVVSKAVDQGSGHAFTTEYAQPTSQFQGQFAQAKWNTKALETLAEPGAFLMKLLEDQYPRTSQLQQLIRKHIPKPAEFEKVTDQEFYNCIQCDGCNDGPCAGYKAAVAKQGFDAKAFAADLQKYVVEPLQAVAKAFAELPYLTRLYTTVSPEEMDKDPIFAFNPDLPAVDRLRTAKALPLCEAGQTQASQVKLTFADGHELVVPVPKDQGNCWDIGNGTAGFGKGTGPLVEAGGQPAKKVQVLDETGAPLDVQPGEIADKVDAELNAAQAGKPSLSEAFKQALPPVTWDYRKPGVQTTQPGADAGGTDAGTAPTQVPVSQPASGCTASPVAAAGPWTLALALLGLLATRRRRA